MKLSPELAQSIVDHMMGQIPYNINIMDEHGYIIASGDPTRINTLHVGAVDAIKQGKTLPMDSKHGDHGQPGVNMPITYDGQIIGVVGITGDPDQVVPLASLLKTSVELLLKQSAADQKERESESRQQRFLYRWLQTTHHEEPSQDLVAEGRQLGIDLTVPRTVVAIRCHPHDLPSLANIPTCLSWILSDEVKLAMIADSLAARQLEQRLTTQKYAFGVSEATQLLGQAADQATTTLRLQTKLGDSHLVHYSQVGFMDLLLKSKLPVETTVKQFSELNHSETGKELIATIGAYIHSNMNINRTAKQLFTHRNTISYRLDRIQEHFQLDPRKLTDLFQLFVGYLYFVDDH